jgi:hypothetical protein
MINLSFFARSPYPKRRDHHLVGGSSIIRAEQIAKYLGAKHNPTSGYENDVCIYVKPTDFEFNNYHVNSNNKVYIDVIDSIVFMHQLHNHHEWLGIVASQYCYDTFKDKMLNKIVFIPQQHCNFERFVRNREEITTVGIIGLPRTFEYSIDEMRQRLEQIGLRLVVNYDFQTREDVVNFYKNIDIQIIWCTTQRTFKNPLKIINAASFSIPTVGFPHNGYREIDGYYVKAQTIDQLINEVEKLKNPENYKIASENLLEMAEKYHISKIAEMYKQL